MKLFEKIDFELAEFLNNRLPSDIYEDKYANGQVLVTWENYLGTKEYQDKEYIVDGEYVHGNFYWAPTYAEVLDWLYDKGIIVEFIPGYTFALTDRIAYCYKVYRKLPEEGGRLPIIFEQLGEMSSFELAMKDIVKKLINEKYIN